MGQMKKNILGSSAERVSLLAGGAGAMAMVLAPSVDAALVLKRGTASFTATSPAQSGTYDAIWLDVDGNTADVEVGVTFNWTYQFFVWANGGAGFELALDTRSLTTAWSNYWLAQKFTNTAAVATHTLWGTASPWANVFYGSGGTGATTWAGTSGYIGYRVPDGGSGYTYGWVQIDVNASLDEVTLLGWSTLSSGSGGGAGGGPGSTSGTPEPAAAGLGLLALGAAGVMRHKRRRKDKVA
jgi:hypothetical protein